jgi:hypothetical protein
MTEPSLPDDVQAFLHDSVESYEEIEVALLLRSDAAAQLAAGDLAARLRTSEDAMTRALRRLRDAGVIACADAGRMEFRFAPRTPALRTTLDRLAAAYDDHRLEVVKLMAANAIERMRSSAARAFADSFVWGRKRSDG